MEASFVPCWTSMSDYFRSYKIVVGACAKFRISRKRYLYNILSHREIPDNVTAEDRGEFGV
jgi:hypothetical protein